MSDTKSSRLEYLQGQIERITYTNEENGYTVARVKVRGRRNLVTVVGNITSPLAGQVLKMKGEWTEHPKFGEQFKAVFCECSVPATSAGIQRYLGSGLIKGIGPVMAKCIVSRYGDQTLDVIDKEADRLIEVGGIGQKRIDKIKKAWEEQKEIREVMIFLQGHGVSSTYAGKIFKTYGKHSIQTVQENPYRLATDIFGIGFITADKIAQKLGFSPESGFRIQAGIIYVLHQLSDEGHVYYPGQDLVQKAAEILKVDESLVAGEIESLKALQHIVVENLPGHEQDAVYLAKFHYSEKSIARKLKKLISSPKSIRSVDTARALEWVQNTFSLSLATKQAEAVETALKDKVLVITGGPGTGKSFLLNAIIKIISRLKAKIILTAPTGRAAKRMQESTGYKAKTIHRLLEFDFQKGGFKKNEEHPLNCDLLIVDEMSMVDTVLMHHLLKAVSLYTTLVMVGDVNQLPSVGPGNVLKDIINSGSVPVVELNEIFRQARESSIIVNAHLINQGEFPRIRPRQDKLDDFFFVQEEDPQKVLEKIKHIVTERIPQRFSLHPVDHVQVISPMNRGLVGVNNLNAELQTCLNPQGREIIRGGKAFRQGDKVMQIRNNYDKEIFNGDIGVIMFLDLEQQEIRVRFDERQVVYDYSDLDDLVLAYAVSIHKSQGSDYPAVVIPLLTQHYIMLQKNLIYTGITRGKNLVVLIGTKKALAIAVRNAKTLERYTYLDRRLSFSASELI